MHKATLASGIKHLSKREILNPVLDVFSASKNDENTVQRSMVSHKSHDVCCLVLEIGFILKLGQIGTKLAIPIYEQVLAAVHNYAV